MTQPTAALTQLTWLTTSIFAEDQFPVDASGNAGGGKIFAGSFVGENGSTGYQRQYVPGDTFVGIALRSADNSGTGNPLGAAGEIGDGTAGSISVPCAEEGYFAWRGTITNLVGDVSEQNTLIYCSDGQTLTTSSGGNSLVGVVVRWDVPNQCWIIRFASAIIRAAT